MKNARRFSDVPFRGTNTFGTTKYDEFGNRIPGEYNEYQEPIGNPSSHNQPTSQPHDWSAFNDAFKNQERGGFAKLPPTKTPVTPPEKNQQPLLQGPMKSGATMDTMFSSTGSTEKPIQGPTATGETLDRKAVTPVAAQDDRHPMMKAMQEVPFANGMKLPPDTDPKSFQQDGAGYSVVVDSQGGPRRVAVTPSYDQIMHSRTGGQWQTWTPDQRRQYLQQNPATSPQGTRVSDPRDAKVMDPNGPGTIINQDGARRLYLHGEEVGHATGSAVTDASGNSYNPQTGQRTAPTPAGPSATPVQDLMGGVAGTITQPLLNNVPRGTSTPMTPAIPAATAPVAAQPAPARPAVTPPITPTAPPQATAGGAAYKIGQGVSAMFNPETYANPAAKAVSAVGNAVGNVVDKASQTGSDFLSGVSGTQPLKPDPQTPAKPTIPMPALPMGRDLQFANGTSISPPDTGPVPVGKTAIVNAVPKPLPNDPTKQFAFQ